MIRTFFRYSLGLISLIFAVVQNCEDVPPFDYPSYPEQPFDFEHMDLEIRLEPELNLARGVVTYSVNPKIDGQTQLVLFTEESAIDGVLIDQMEADYKLEGESLIIILPDSSIKDQEFEIAVTWQSNSSFGLYKDHEGNFWSSKNPLAHRHWFPVFDHPRNELTFEAHISIPYEYEVLFNGDFVNDEAQAGNRKKIHYTSDVPIPVTGLGFAMGDFLISEVTSGLTTVRLFSSQVKVSEEVRTSLIREASQLKKDVEKVLSMEYPWKGLNIVILSDNYWEERTHGSGTIFLYENMGSFSNQLKRGIYSQWLGEYVRNEQFFDFDHAGEELMRTTLHFAIHNEPFLIENSDSLNTVHSWNLWQQSFQKKSELFQETVKTSLPELIREEKGITSFNDFADFWYDETGISWHDVTPENFSLKEKESALETKYSLKAQYDEVSSNLNLIFELQSGDGSPLYSLIMKEFTFDNSVAHELSFTGEIDTLSIELTPSVEYISFDGESISLNQVEIFEMPLFFLLNQLRSTNAEDRKMAATLLSDHGGNPDLQLALNDVLSFEENPEVRAELLLTMAKITDGATGTEQMFINSLSSDDLEIKRASLTALTNYPGNDMVISSIRSNVLRAQNEEIFKLALTSFAEVVTGEELISLARRLQRIDSTGFKTLTILENYPDPDTSSVFVSIAEDYLTNSYSYSIRKKALQFLIINDSNPENWKGRLINLLEDRDPRIRYESLSGYRLFRASEAFDILSSVERNEFDARVLIKVDNLLEKLSN